MWFVIWTLAKSEEELKTKIDRDIPRNFYKSCFIPKRKELRKYRGEEKEVLVKLFPGYVFIDTEEPERIHLKLRSEKEYIKFLKSDDRFVPIEKWEEDIIRHFTNEEGIADLSLGIKESDGKIKILSGPLKGMEDKITHIDRHKKKAKIKIDNLLGKDRVLTFGLEVVEKVNSR